MLCPTGNRSHREPAGVGKQIQHPLAFGLRFDPITAIPHVEKQPIVLFAPQVHPIAQPAFGQRAFINGLTHQPFTVALQRLPMLHDQCVRTTLLPHRGMRKVQQQRFQRNQ